MKSWLACERACSKWAGWLTEQCQCQSKFMFPPFDKALLANVSSEQNAMNNFTQVRSRKLCEITSYEQRSWSKGLRHLWNLLESLKHPRPEMPREPLCWRNISTPWMYKAPNKIMQNGLLLGVAWSLSCDIYVLLPDHVRFVSFSPWEKLTDSREEQYILDSTRCLFVCFAGSLHIQTDVFDIYIYIHVFSCVAKRL